MDPNGSLKSRASHYFFTEMMKIEIQGSKEIDRKISSNANSLQQSTGVKKGGGKEESRYVKELRGGDGGTGLVIMFVTYSTSQIPGHTSSLNNSDLSF